MAQHDRPTKVPVGAVGVALVLVLAGMIFAANARLAATAAPVALDFPGLVQAELDRAAEVSAEVSELRAEVDTLLDGKEPDVAPSATDELRAFWAGRRAAVGPGLSVTLTDASPTAPRPPWATPNDLVIHQQDLQAVINALWAGGAEAMTLQDQRVIATSAFRCVGNVLLLHGRHFSPPYTVRAIGDPDRLHAALLADPQVQLYLEYVDAVGLGWNVAVESELQLPAYDHVLSLTHAGALVPDAAAEETSDLTSPGVSVDDLSTPDLTSPGSADGSGGAA